MNYRFVFNQFGLLLLGFAVVMSVLAAAFFGIEGALGHEIRAMARVALLASAGVGFVIGGALWLATRKAPKKLTRREALLLVAVSWVVGAAFAALPAYLWGQFAPGLADDHPFRSFTNCYFEAMSGLTTTGATVLGDIEAIPRSLLLWRAVTHWLGGLGIVVLFVAVLPSLGVGGRKLAAGEMTGPRMEGLQPQIRDTVQVLWMIYVGLTVAEILLLRVAGMGWFDSICHTFATLATGGFSTRTASVGAYDMLAVRIIIIAFMILAAINFGLYYQVIRGRVRSVFKDPELRLYVALLALGFVLVLVAIVGQPITLTTGETVDPSIGTSVTEALFTTVSIQTTTGFCTSDFNTWPFLAKAVLVILMFVGGCAGSTGGGIKVIRIWIALKVILAEIERSFRPQVIRPVRVGEGTIDAEMKLSTIAYVLGTVVLFAAGSGAIMLLERYLNQDLTHEMNYATAATASIASLCTIGPGLDLVGAVNNYGWMTIWSKWVLCVLMALGRLEVFAIIVLFTPRFWRGD